MGMDGKTLERYWRGEDADDGAGWYGWLIPHLQGGGKGDSGGAEATRSSDLGLMEVVVGGIGGRGGGGCGCQGRGSF